MINPEKFPLSDIYRKLMNILSIKLFFSALVCPRLFQMLRFVNPTSMLMSPIRTSLPATALLAIFICFFSCNPPQEDKNANETTGAADTVAPETANSCLINGELPVLWIEATEFQKLRGQPAFRFYIDSNRDLTLSAWNKPYDDKPPVFTMRTSVLSGVQASIGNFLGNLILPSQMRADIEKEIRDSGWKIVRFIPFLDTSAVGKNQVIYHIELTKDAMPPRPLNSRDQQYFRRDTAAAVLQSDYQLNPSPPRNE